METMEKELEKEQNHPSQKDPNKYCVEYRRKLYKDLEKEKLENEKKEKKKVQKEPYGMNLLLKKSLHLFIKKMEK